MSESGEEVTRSPPRGRTYLLASKRLTMIQLGTLAGALELRLSTETSLDDTRGAINEKLTELGKMPEEVQVIVADPLPDGSSG